MVSSVLETRDNRQEENQHNFQSKLECTFPHWAQVTINISYFQTFYSYPEKVFNIQYLMSRLMTHKKVLLLHDKLLHMCGVLWMQRHLKFHSRTN